MGLESLMREMMARLDATEDTSSFYREGARQVRALTGFDRVMVYRFDRDGSGEVVAEAARAGIGSFLDLRYPSSDIPQQARKLYIRTPFRIIADIDATPVPILPRLDETGSPIDLSLSVLRSVSPIHIEYLKNMGVGASLSISIIVEGRDTPAQNSGDQFDPRFPDLPEDNPLRKFFEQFGGGILLFLNPNPD